MARVQVQAFSVRAIVEQTKKGRPDPFSMRASGSASTDAEGRFHISGLEADDYLVAAQVTPSLTSGEARRMPLYGTTFHPSTTNYREAVPVLAAPNMAPIRVVMARVNGARVTGSVADPSGQNPGGMNVLVFHRFGDFSFEVPVGVVSASGAFEVPPLPPGSYTLTIFAIHGRFRFWCRS